MGERLHCYQAQSGPHLLWYTENLNPTNCLKIPNQWHRQSRRHYRSSKEPSRRTKHIFHTGHLQDALPFDICLPKAWPSSKSGDYSIQHPVAWTWTLKVGFFCVSPNNNSSDNNDNKHYHLLKIYNLISTLYILSHLIIIRTRQGR